MTPLYLLSDVILHPDNTFFVENLHISANVWLQCRIKGRLICSLVFFTLWDLIWEEVVQAKDDVVLHRERGSKIWIFWVTYSLNGPNTHRNWRRVLAPGEAVLYLICIVSGHYRETIYYLQVVTFCKLEIVPVDEN